MTRPAPPQQMDFSPKLPKIPQLESYKGSLPEDYWSTWPHSPLSWIPSSWINSDALCSLAEEIHFPDMHTINSLAAGLKSGVTNGARGAGRLPAHGKNLSSFYDNGYRAADAIASWVHDKLIAGPLDRLVRFIVNGCHLILLLPLYQWFIQSIDYSLTLSLLHCLMNFLYSVHTYSHYINIESIYLCFDILVKSLLSWAPPPPIYLQTLISQKILCLMINSLINLSFSRISYLNLLI